MGLVVPIWCVSLTDELGESSMKVALKLRHSMNNGFPFSITILSINFSDNRQTQAVGLDEAGVSSKHL